MNKIQTKEQGEGKTVTPIKVEKRGKGDRFRSKKGETKSLFHLKNKTNYWSYVST